MSNFILLLLFRIRVSRGFKFKIAFDCKMESFDYHVPSDVQDTDNSKNIKEFKKIIEITHF